MIDLLRMRRRASPKAERHVGTPSERHRRHDAALARAQATEGIATG